MVILSLVTGDYAVSFWVFEVLLGMVIPMFLLIRSRGNNFNMMLVASGLMMVGIFFMRYNIVLPGQMFSVYHDLGVEEAMGKIDYMPSFHEIVISVCGMTFVILAYLVGEKMLNGHQLEKHEIVPEGGYVCSGCGGIHYMREGETEEEAMKRHYKIF